jgi:hypothetical protein
VTTEGVLMSQFLWHCSSFVLLCRCSVAPTTHVGKRDKVSSILFFTPERPILHQPILGIFLVLLYTNLLVHNWIRRVATKIYCNSQPTECVEINRQKMLILFFTVQTLFPPKNKQTHFPQQTQVFES